MYEYSKITLTNNLQRAYNHVALLYPKFIFQSFVLLTTSIIINTLMFKPHSLTKYIFTKKSLLFRYFERPLYGFKI